MADESKGRPPEAGNGAEEGGQTPSSEETAASSAGESKAPEEKAPEPEATETGAPETEDEAPEAEATESETSEAQSSETQSSETQSSETQSSETQSSGAEPPEDAAPAADSKAPESDEASAAAEAEERAKAAAAAKAKAEAAAKAKAAREAAEAAKPPWERDPQTPEWLEADDDPLARTLRERHADAIESTRTFAGDLTIEVRRADIADVCATLKQEGFTLPVDICGAHYPDRESGQFEVVYHLYSFDANRRIRVKVRVDEGEEVPSVVSVWVGANWPEREAYDMYGIRFSDHPDLTRILMWEGFNGYPLRKDFPIEGIDTGSAIYPEYYEDEAGPVAGTGTGWKPPKPPDPPAPPEEAAGDDGAEPAGDA